MERLLPRSPTLTYDEETGLAVPVTAVWMICLTIFMDSLAATISTPVLPYYARKFDVSNAGIGYLFAAWSLTSTFCAPMLNRLSDRIGRRTVLVMSLVGAGTASLGQGMAWNYWMLFAMRSFSGVWAAVNSSAQVYLADVCAPASLPTYMARLSSVPAAAMIFGPGLGGGLSKFGLNVPIIVDGFVCLACALLVYIYLPESPVWLASRQTKDAFESQGQRKAGPVTPTPRSAHVLGFAGLLQGIAFGTSVCMTAVSLDAKLGFGSLEVGYAFMAFALIFLCTGIWVTPRVQHWLGVSGCATLGTCINAVGLAMFGLCESQWTCLAWMAVARAGATLGSAPRGSMAAQLCDVTNRGAVFSHIQLMTNFGRLVAPVVAGNLATRDAKTAPWIFAAACCSLSAAVLPWVRLPGTERPRDGQQPAGPPAPRLVRGFTGIENAEDPERGSAQDYEELGRYVGDLLTRRRYRWVSRPAAVRQMLDALLPELSATSSEHRDDLEKLLRHASALREDFGDQRFE